jgi:hypothetical protein
MYLLHCLLLLLRADGLVVSFAFGGDFGVRPCVGRSKVTGSVIFVCRSGIGCLPLELNFFGSVLIRHRFDTLKDEGALPLTQLRAFVDWGLHGVVTVNIRSSAAADLLNRLAGFLATLFNAIEQETEAFITSFVLGVGLPSHTTLLPGDNRCRWFSGSWRFNFYVPCITSPFPTENIHLLSPPYEHLLANGHER